MSGKFMQALNFWLDTTPPETKAQKGIDVIPALEAQDLVRCIPYLAMHLCCLFALSVGVSPLAIGVAVGAYLVRMFAITGFYHRYFSHRTFKTSRFWQFVFAFIGACSVQRGPIWWAAHHRFHHRHSDTAKDPHSPHMFSFFWSHTAWFMSHRHFSTRSGLVKDWTEYPELRILDRFDILAPTLYALALFGIGEWLAAYHPSWGTDGWQLLIWGFCISTVVLYHATFSINSLAHRWGTRRFDTKDHSRNNGFLALITLGEGWHNNHHRYPGSVDQGFYWWEVDITSMILKGMSRLGMVWDLKPVPEKILKEGRNS